MNTETRFYSLSSFDESYSLYVINATEVKNNIPAETALGSGTIDNLQTFLKYPFPFWCESLSLMQASQQNHIYSWITTQGKLTSDFSWETAAYILLNENYCHESYFWNGYLTLFLMPIALSSFVCCTLKLMFEESRIFGSKAHGFFPLCFRYMYYF